jgi:hypothetical protein
MIDLVKQLVFLVGSVKSVLFLFEINVKISGHKHAEFNIHTAVQIWFPTWSLVEWKKIIIKHLSTSTIAKIYFNSYLYNLWA